MNTAILSLVLLAGTPPVVETEPAPRTQLFVRTAPSGATVSFNGKQGGKSPQLFDVPKGVSKMVIEVELDGHYRKKQQIIVRGGRITRVELTMKPDPVRRRFPMVAPPGATAKSKTRPLDLPPERLILYYPFERSKGKTVVDASGNGNQGTIHGAAYSTEGKRGWGMAFNGSEYIRCEEIEIGPAVTWSVWIKLIHDKKHIAADQSARHLGLSRTSTARSGGWASDLERIPADFYIFRVGEGSDIGDVHNYWAELLDLDSDGKLEIRTGGTKVSAVDGTAKVTDDGKRWHHLVLTVDKKGQLISYLDGKVDAKGLVDTGVVKTVLLAEAGFQGVMDEVMIFDRALSPTEVRTLIDRYGDKGK